ncbi:MAG: hypothetical protein IKK04_04325 [Bacteroidales bacterium]|nr:hypothetical protein [Bacteroidales bacterium]
MKRINTTMIVGLMATIVIVAAGCKREYGTVTLGANIDNGRDAKVYIDDLTPCWHNNDLIRVNNQTCTTSAALGSSAQITDVVESNHYRAIYPADIVGDVDISSSSTIAVTLPHEQIYEVDSRGDQKVKVPMGAYSSSESLTFHNLCPLIKVVVSNRMDNDFVLDHITVTSATSYLSGLCSATVTGSPNDHIGTMVPSSASHDVSLVFPLGNRPTIGRGDRDTYVYYIVSPEFGGDEGEDVTITIYSTTGQYATFEKRASLRHNRMAEVSLTVGQWNGQGPIDPPSGDGVLPGAFSVSATQQVHFSQGNLQYQASTDTWRFAEHQYDYVGSANRNISSTYNGWIDLFGWGTSGWNSGANCYQPWSTSTSYIDYYPGGSYTNGLTGAYAEADWAWHNAISNGGNATHQWRTLTRSEWNYLLNSRTNASSKLGTGNINGVGGLIILPDSWTQPSGCPQFNSGFPSSGDGDWTRNSYTLAHWAQMEAAGAVFLPAAGSRFGTDVDDVGYYGNYWSSSPYLGYSAYLMYFYSDYFDAAYDNDRCYGFSVRPVR